MQQKKIKGQSVNT